MLQRFPVLRKAKDEGRDIRTQIYSQQGREMNKEFDEARNSLNNSQPVINIETAEYKVN